LLAEQSSATTMRQAIEWSWQLLKPAERSAFMQCSVFSGPFSLRAAEAVITLEPGAGAVLDVVHSLREQSLLGSRAEGGAMRLSMPAVVREFAREQLARAANDARVAERHAAYCEALVRAGASAELKALDSAELVAAVVWSSSEEGRAPERALRLLLA